MTTAEDDSMGGPNPQAPTPWCKLQPQHDGSMGRTGINADDNTQRQNNKVQHITNISLLCEAQEFCVGAKVPLRCQRLRHATLPRLRESQSLPWGSLQFDAIISFVEPRDWAPHTKAETKGPNS